MVGREGEDRTMVVCTDCGTPYAARELADGELLPIGGRNACDCGSTEFDKVDTEIVFDEDEVKDPED